MQARALYAYEAQGEGHLTLKPGDLIGQVRKMDNDWAYGEVEGQQGYFPLNYVQMVEGAEAKEEASVLETRVALYDFSASSPAELSLVAGQTIQVTAILDENWCQGYVEGGGSGAFPSNYTQVVEAEGGSKEGILENQGSGGVTAQTAVKEHVASASSSSGSVDTDGQEEERHTYYDSDEEDTPEHVARLLAEEEAAQAAQETQGPKARALFAYFKGGDDELGFQKDDEITVLSKDTEEWWTGELHGEVGVFPANYVQLLDVEDTRELDSDDPMESDDDDMASTMSMASAGSSSTWGGTSSESDSFCVQAMYGYEARSGDELGFAPGDEFMVTDASNEGWWRGVTNDGREGLFPANYVQRVASTSDGGVSGRSVRSLLGVSEGAELQPLTMQDIKKLHRLSSSLRPPSRAPPAPPLGAGSSSSSRFSTTRAKSMMLKRTSTVFTSSSGTELQHVRSGYISESPGDTKFRFDLIKLCHRVKQQRIWEMNIEKGTLANVTSKKGVKTMRADRVVQIEKTINDPQHLLLVFDTKSKTLIAKSGFQRAAKGKTHPYDLYFSTGLDRELFFLLVCGVRESERMGFQTQTMDVQFESLSVFVGSWNMGNAPPPISMAPWIPKNKYDVYAIGVQECKYEPRQTPTKYSSCEHDWSDTLNRHFGSEYVRVCCESLWEIRLAVFLRKELLPSLANVQIDTEATGIGNVLGNKGGVGCSFTVYQTSLCFITAHLAAHQHKTQARNDNARDIFNNLSLGKHTLDLCSQFDHIFFFGDLNYRIDCQDWDTTIGHIERQEWDTLLTMDQLVEQQAQGVVFHGFTDERPQFAPTYRFERPRTSNLPSTHSTKRLPAYCDRILHRGAPNSRISLETFDSCEDIFTSDHNPVYGVYNVGVELPYTACVFAPSQATQILITELNLYELNLQTTSGLANKVFLSFHSKILEGTPFSEMVELDDDGTSVYFDQVKPLEPFVTQLEYLRDTHLTLALHPSTDTAVKCGIQAKSNLLAQFNVSLQGVDDLDVHTFETEVTVAGIYAGRALGKVQVLQWGE